MVARSMPMLTGPVRIALDGMPPWSIYRLSMGGGWLLSVSAMLEAGLVNKDVLQNVLGGAAGNPWLHERTQAVIDRLALGLNLGEAMDTRFRFPDAELVEDMRDYAKSSNFSLVMARIGKEWIGSAVEKIAGQSAVVNNVFTALAMALIGMLAASMVMLSMSIGAAYSAG
jgi:hypothetical protein